MKNPYESNHDWARRANELMSSIGEQISVADVFTSRQGLSVVEEALYRKAESIISGACEYLREQGFSITPKEERDILDKIQINCIYSPKSAQNPNPCTAETRCADSRFKITVNAGHEYVQDWMRGDLMWSAVCGLLYHELAHVLFLSFPTLRSFIGAVERGQWFPRPPQNIATTNGAMLGTRMQEEEFRKLVSRVAAHINNALEDGYVEAELTAMYPGSCKQALSTINERLLEGIKPVDEELDVPEPDVFSAIMSQVLCYAKFQKMEFGNKCPDDVRDALEACLMPIDDARSNRIPEQRCNAVNELLVELFPYIEEAVDKKAAQIQKQKQNGNKNSTGKTGSSTGAEQPGAGNGGPSAQDVADAISQIIEDLEKSAQATGIADHNKGQMTTRGLANKSSRDNKGGEKSVRKTEAKGGSGGPGSLEAGGMQTAAEREFDSLRKDLANKKATEQAEVERTQELAKQAESICNATVKRAPNVTQDNINEYNRNASDFQRIASDLTRSIMQVLKDRREGGRRKNLVTGRRFEASHWCLHDDFRDFSKIKWPTESPTFGFGLLIDESGSTGGELIKAACKAAIVLELFADKKEGLDIKHITYGYTTASGWNTCLLKSYSEPEKIADDDVYRITGMRSGGGTPTCAAMEYMRNRILSLPTDVKMMIIITDGQSGDNSKVGNSTRLQNIIKECKKDGIEVLAAGIGHDREIIRKEFGDNNFLDISNLEQMPAQLASIIKGYMWC